MERSYKKWRSILSVLAILCCTILTSAGEINAQELIKGTVSDEDGMSLPGVSILIKGTTTGTETDFDGNYAIAAKEGDLLQFTFVGMSPQEITVGKESTINVVMNVDAEALEEVVLVSFGKQKKSSMVASITTVKPDELRVPTSNLTQGLLGQVAGLTGFQNSGEPGADNVEFFIRGVTTFGFGSSPLILIDGVELTVEDLSRLHPDDIASFSIMKDATATALYGARGANGVIFVSTKEGAEGPLSVNVRVEASRSEATQDVELVDPISYMELYNEAVTTRDPLAPLPFSQRKIDNTIAGTNPILYPTVDWQKELFKDYATNKRMNMNLSGGGKKARYFISLALNHDTGILKVPEVSNFNSNIDLKKYMFRSNTNINLTSTTKLKMGFNANYTDYSGPLESGSVVYNQVRRASPVAFRPFYEKDAEHQYTNHILFGNDFTPDGSFYLNPYSNLVRGYRESTTSKIIAQLELFQDLNMITEGLSFKTTMNVTRASSYAANRRYNPYFYRPVVTFQDDGSETVSYESLNPTQGTEHLDFAVGANSISSTTYFESRLNYSQTFNEKHDVGGLVVFTLNNRLSTIPAGTANDQQLILSLPYRNLGLAGRFTYGYDTRYMFEVNFGYNGSERFAENERYGLFPSVGLGWLVTNESFMDGGIKNVLSNLKLRGSYGYVGNDRIGSEFDRFFYLSQVNLSDNTRGYTFGENFSSTGPGVSISRYENDLITWENAEKVNIGANIGLFNKLNIEVDVFKEWRRNILATRIVPASLGLEAAVRDNIGEATSSGIDGSVVYTQNFNSGLWVQGRGNFTYATSEITKMEEPDYTDTPWLSRVGQPINQNFGYIAERLFVDELEVQNSPAQGFGEYGAGDIKYRDINGDDKITALDQVPIGHARSPEIVYGFGLSTGYKGFDLSAFFQGNANASFWVDPINVSPFVGQKNFLKAYADDHWSEDNRNVYAKWPRLSTEFVDNNTQRSTWFLEDGSFLTLKNVEFGYTLPEKFTSKLKLQKFRVYTTGVNLYRWSSFKLWDSAMGGNGFAYPTQRIINIGAQISL